MNLTRFIAGAAAVVALATAATPAVALATPKASSIRSTSIHTCLDPSVAGNPYDTLAGAPCSGSAAQTFAFIPIAGGPAHTYEIQSKASGDCIVQFRFGILQGGCSRLPTASDAWTLQQVGSSAKQYQIVLASTVGGSYPGCWNVSPRGRGQPGPLFGFHLCSGEADATFALVAGL